MIHAFDAGPMIAYLTGEEGSEVAERILLENPGECYGMFSILPKYTTFFCDERASTLRKRLSKPSIWQGLYPVPMLTTLFGNPPQHSKEIMR